MSVIIYTRTSTDAQTLGHEGQMAECVEWIAKEGLDIAGVYSDTISGATELAYREGFTNALSALKEGDILLTWRRDRLGRDVLINAVGEKLIREKGARYHSLDTGGTDTPEQRLMATLLDAIAQYERACVIMRTNVALEAKRKKGLCTGNTQIGQTKEVREDGKNYIINDEVEMSKIEQVREWRISGMTLADIVDKCTDEGITSRSGKTPDLSTISRWCDGYAPKVKPKHRPAKRTTKAGRKPSENKMAGLAKLICTLKDSESSLTWSQIESEVKDAGFVNSKGNPLAQTQLKRIYKRALASA